MKRPLTLTRRIASRVRGAVVRVERFGGQGVLVPGGFVLTAAHCIEWTSECYEQIVTADGRTLAVSPRAIETVGDVAVLGAVDEQNHPELAEAFEEFCTATPPVPLASDGFRVLIARDAFVFTHDKGILPARATVGTEDANWLGIETDAGIDSGSSGGPIVNRDGRLLGIISRSGGSVGDPPHVSLAARVFLSAPVWFVRKMVPLTELVRFTEALDYRDVKAKPGKGGR